MSFLHTLCDELLEPLNGLEFSLPSEETVPLLILQDDTSIFDNGSVADSSRTNINNGILTEGVQLNGLTNTLSKNVVAASDGERISEKIKGEHTEASAEFDRQVDNFVQKIVLYRCKLCKYESEDKFNVINHLKVFHLVINVKKEYKVKDCRGKNDEARAVEGNSAKLNVTKDKHSATAYMCGRCSLPFATLAQVKQHMSSEHPPSKKRRKRVKEVMGKEEVGNEVKKVTDVEVEQSDKASHLLDKAKSSQTSCPDLIKEKTVKCGVKVCAGKFSSETAMSAHQEYHDSDDPSVFKCRHCTSTYHKWVTLADHLWRSHYIDIDLFKCSVCQFRAVRKKSLIKHYKLHGIDDTLEESSFCSLVKRDHRLKKGECEECGAVFSDVKAAKKHRKVVHGDLRPYVCHVCAFSSSRKDTLSLHMRQHTGEKPFACNVCNFKSRDHNTLRRHKLRHGDQRPYPCPHCPYSSLQSARVKDHMQRIHPELGGVFKCSHCTFTTLSDKLITNHNRIHHKEGRSNKSDTASRDRNFSFLFPSSVRNEKDGGQSKPEDMEDEESSSQCFFEFDHVDTGGITIPAEETKPQRNGPLSPLNQTVGDVPIHNENAMAPV